MRNFKLTIAYDGTEFHGWQRQPGLRTVQQVVEIAIGTILGVRVNATASGRTDAGVHAHGQVAQFYAATRLPPDVLLQAINAKLPVDVRVIEVEEVPESFHATLDARRKTYRYAIDNGPIPDLFQRRYAWHVPRPIDEDAMRRASSALLGRHDFRSFETSWPNRTSSVRTILGLDVRRSGREIQIDVEADGFLYNMVRCIVGTLVLVGTGRRPESFVGDALRAESRTEAGPNAPPQGLFLLKVCY